MEANTTVIRHWEDVVFENRNKLYGAYILRRAYSSRLLVGWAMTILVLSLVLSLQRTSSGEEDQVIARPWMPEGEIKLQQPPTLKPRTQTPVRQPENHVRERNIVVTRDEVITEQETEAIEDFVSESGSGLGEIGIIDGEGTIPVVDPLPVVEPPFRDFAEVMPQYDGGLEAMMKFIQKKIRYPRAPREMGIDGTVYVRFLVNGDGTVSDVEIIKSVHPDYDKEAARVISMLPSWKGGSHNGRPVSVRMVLPIKFSLK